MAPGSGKITNIALGYQRDIFCSGMSVLPDGWVFIAGGTCTRARSAAAWPIRPFSTRPAWTPTGPMHHPREWANTVLLPDGTVLVVGGGRKDDYGEPVFSADIYHPAGVPSVAHWVRVG